MPLDLYRRKRDFTITLEPSGEKASEAGNTYLIQKHAARRLHYDLRLEMDGVLKSWAVTRGPSLNPGDKRLAVHVEDHPLDYGSFEGTIPKGQYGGGTVMLWDRGSWTPIGDPHAGYKKGHLEFELYGEKLSGHWHLVRMHPRRGEKADNWLLIKVDDEAARAKGAADVLDELPNSVKTGRTIDEITKGAPARKASKDMPKRVKRATKTKARTAAAEPMPDFVPPQLASLKAKVPAGKDWVHEIKFDGYRLQARIDKAASSKSRVQLFTRSGLDWTERFGSTLRDALAALPVENALIDGELVVEGDGGASSFSMLQQDLAEDRHDRFVLYVFDLLHLDGRDLRELPLKERQAKLAQVLAEAKPPLRLSEPFSVDGATMLRHACRLSLEGLVSKRASAPYRSGRSKDWIKSKCAFRQEFVIGGYMPSSARKGAIGSLVLGIYDKGKLRHVGRVGTGFSERVARELHERLAPLARQRSPFAGTLSTEARRGVCFVSPQLVAEVEFRGWTGDEHLRHAVFRGTREDKPAREIIREDAAMANESGDAAVAPRSGVKLTHPDRLYWPEDGITKQGLVDYYAQVWPFIAPFIVARPLALLRCPGGIAQACFFQKHAWRGINKAIKIAKDSDGQELLTIDDFDGLVALAQAGTLEIHPWGAPLADLERPDILTFDLDPGDDVSWPEMVAGAREVRARLETAGLPSFVKTSGGKGLHVVVPLKPKAGWAQAKAFAKDIAVAMAADDPGSFIAVATKARRRGRIFVDYLRNGRGATAITAYGTRARPGAAVSMPAAWEELDAITSAAQFTIDTTPVRLANLNADPWIGFRKTAQPLPTASSRKRVRTR